MFFPNLIADKDISDWFYITTVCYSIQDSLCACSYQNELLLSRIIKLTVSVRYFKYAWLEMISVIKVVALRLNINSDIQLQMEKNTEIIFGVSER